jgi:hypothetical protein
VSRYTHRVYAPRSGRTIYSGSLARCYQYVRQCDSGRFGWQVEPLPEMVTGDGQTVRVAADGTLYVRSNNH